MILPKPAEMEAAVRALVSARPLSVGTEVTVPVAYSGGEIASVIVEQAGEELRVHDGGAGAMQLSAEGVSINRSIAERLRAIAARFQCTYENGRVSSIARADDLGIVICLVANASRGVADYTLEMRRHMDADFQSLVADRLRSLLGERFRENEEFRGKSGRKYRIPGLLLDRTGSAPTHFIAALANRRNVDHNFAMLYDLKRAYPAVENDAVYDESGDFRTEDHELLKSVSTPLSLIELPIRFQRAAGHS